LVGLRSRSACGIVIVRFQPHVATEMELKNAAASTLAVRLAWVREQIDEAANRAGRRPKEITLVVVSKTHPVESIQQAIAAGATDLGENRVQEAELKIPLLGSEKVRWHLIGHLQSNKARRAVELFDVIHSVDSVALARRLDRLCQDLDREMLSVLIQIDLGGEATKTGASEKELARIVDAMSELRRLRLTGLMTLPPYFEDPNSARPFFRRLRQLRDELREQGGFGNQAGELSMGMTNDYQVAIEEGATIVRVGTAIFGART
jgi:PLP dependent protein